MVGGRLAEASALARRALAAHGRCRAVCGSTGSMRIKSLGAFERAVIPIVLANPLKMKAVSQAGAKTDKADAKAIACLLSVYVVPACHVPDQNIRSQKQAPGHRIVPVQSMTRMSNRAGRPLGKYDVRPAGTKIVGAKNIRLLEQAESPNKYDEMYCAMPCRRSAASARG